MNALYVVLSVKSTLHYIYRFQILYTIILDSI